MMHGTADAVSATSNNGAPAVGGPAVQKQKTLSSLANSLSSSSVMTIKRTGSRSSSRTGTRESRAPMRSQSPGEPEPSRMALHMGRDHVSQEHQRRRSVAVDPSAKTVDSDGLNHLVRWAHSSSPSVNSVANTRRSRASSGVALPNSAAQLFSSQTRNRSSLGQSPRSSPQAQPVDSRPSFHRRLGSPERSPDGKGSSSQSDRITSSLTALPSLHTTPALTDPDDTASPATIQDLQTPSTVASYNHPFGQDYFGGDDGASPRSKVKSQKPGLIRNYTAPMSTLTQARGGGHEIAPKQALRRTNTSEMREIGAGAAGVTGSHHHGRRRSRTREGREKDKKSMLSKALQKANTAVLLDNAQNFEGALEAYSDACRLLQQVMDRSAGLEDKRKLEAIRVTYTNRIEELRQLETSRPSTAEDKDLPARPMSDDSLCLSPVTSAATGPIDAMVANAPTARFSDAPHLSYSSMDRDSFFVRTMEAVEESAHSGRGFAPELPEGRRDDATTGAAQEPEDRLQYSHLTLPRSDHEYMPAPLLPRRPSSPQLKSELDAAWAHEPEHAHSATQLDERGHAELSSAESKDNSGSWLDTIDESGSDSASVHSFSQNGLRRKHLRNLSNTTDPDFDAAFDAAVEAAYNEGLEPDTGARQPRSAAYRHMQQDSIALPASDIKEVLSPTADFHPGPSFNVDMSDEDEERLLDDITQDYSQSFNFDLSSKSALPRQSDSSGCSRSTWQSSQASVDRTTAATSLSTVEEDAFSLRDSHAAAGAPSIATALPLTPAPPLNALPPPPTPRSSGVRSRRMSGVNAKQLKIETAATRPDSRKRASTFHHSPSPRFEDEEKEALGIGSGSALLPKPSNAQHGHILTSPPSLELRSAVSDTRPRTAKSPEKRRSLDERAGDLLSPGPALFRKNNSSVSLREHTVLLASPDIDTIPSAITPMSSTFMAYHYASKKLQDPLTSQRARFPSFDTGYNNVLSSGGSYLFDTSLSATQAQMSPKSPNEVQPMGLEPCPESFLLRPFWLMRALSNTLTHPKGGFVTTKLFVPREVWHTKAVKLKAVEDKVANCDLLTAALGRLAGVDTYDADAVMEELQNFEEVMERVQIALIKKLGNDVGLHGIAGLFKDAPTGVVSPGSTTQSADTVAGAERTSKGKEGKGYLNSWRKLRNKSSGAPLSSGQPAIKATDREVQTMASVPMTTFVPIERRGNKRNIRNMTFDGPQKEYMGSLARLFDAAQVLDQIARQVEDPGLKHSSPTHVGLELSIRHAAEFFGFYITRFVLADLGVLLDKFVKRGTEWALA